MNWKRPKDEGEAIVLAIRDPLRRRLLAAIAEGEASPKQLEARFGETLQVVAYHVRALAFYEVIDLSETRRVRGSTQHFYVVNDLGLRALVLAKQTGMLDGKGDKSR